MTDLHGWITQQVDRVEATARAATPGLWAAKTVIYGKPEDGYGPPSDWEIHAGRTEVVSHLMHEGGGIQHWPDALHIAAHHPTAVLRRCEADRRILADHCLVDTGYSLACEGCGTWGICQDWVTDNINDCPMLLAIAHAHGLTDETLPGLDRPQAPEVKPRPMGQLAAQLWDGQIRTSLSDVPEPLRGPNWSSR